MTAWAAPEAPHTTPLRTLAVGAAFRFYGQRYTVDAEADEKGLIRVRDGLGGLHLFTVLAMVEAE